MTLRTVGGGSLCGLCFCTPGSARVVIFGVAETTDLTGLPLDLV